METILGHIILSLFTCFFIAILLRRWRLPAISAYPGPWQARYTSWYRAYYDVVKFGGLLNHLQELHNKYGPVVRIGPNELHFQSPQAYFEIYSYGNFTKEPSLYNSFPFHEASISYIDRQKANKRRDVLGPLFSRSAILKLEWVIQEKIDKLILRLLSHEDKAVDLHMAVRSSTIDIIAKYCFGKSFNALNAPDFQDPILVGLQTGLTASWILKYLPFLLTMLEKAPDWAIDMLPPDKQFYRDLRTYASSRIDSYLANPESLDVADQATIFHHLLHSPRDTPSRTSLMGETMALLAAGHETVGSAFTVATFYILRNPEVKAKLLKELLQAWPDAHVHMNYQALEHLPYLTAVIKESLRLSHGVVSNLPRVTEEPMMISGYQVPKHTIVSTSSIFIHLNPEIFPDPHTFKPGRWLEPNATELANYLVPFSRGSRKCLGVNLAWCELYLLFAHMFRKLDMTPFNASDSDYRTFRDFFVPVWDGNRLHLTVKPAKDWSAENLQMQ